MPTTVRSRSIESASLPALVVVGEHRADVAAAAGAEQGVDHRVGEDVGVGVAGEAKLVLDLDAAEDQPAARGRSGGCRSRSRSSPDQPGTRDSAPSGTEAPLAALEDADLADPERLEELDRAVVGEADLLGQVGVGGEREGDAGLDAELGEAAGRVELADRLAQAGGRELDRDAALGDRLDRGLVEGARVALGQRPGPAPDLDQVGVGEDVEEARAGALGEAPRSSGARPRRGRRRPPRRPSPSWSTAASPSPTKWTEPTT